MNVLELIESIARERCIDQTTVKQVMESILLDFAASKFGNEDILQSKLHDDGSFEIFLNQIAVEDEEKDDRDFSQIAISKAKTRNPNIQLGEIVKEVLPFAVGQSDIEKIFLTLRTKLNEAQRKKEYDVFLPHVGTMMVGYIKRVDLSEAIISFPEGEGVLRKNEMLPNDMLRAGNYVKVFIKDLRPGVGRQIFLSRTADGFLRELMKQEVPEIQDGIVEIKAIARDVGSLAKVAVHSLRPSINPISVCIGPYGARIQAVTKELLGEKVSIVEWNENLHQFIANALAPANVIKITEKADKKFEVTTSQEQFSKAMGRGGQNVVLAKKLCSAYSIKLLTEEEEAKIYQEQISKQSSELVEKLEIEDMMAHLLISEGLNSVWKIAIAQIEKIGALNGFDLDLAKILQERAQEFIELETNVIKEKLKSLEKNDSIFEITGFSMPHISHLISQSLFEKTDIAMLDAGELKDMFEDLNELYISFDQAQDIIANARGINRRSE